MLADPTPPRHQAPALRNSTYRPASLAPVLALRLRDRPELCEVPQPPPLPGEALVAVRKAGICATDLEVMRGYAPFRGVMGHEMVGVVHEAPGHAASWEGRRVTAEINIRCGTCASCLAGRGNHCEGRGVLGIRERDGVFAQYVRVPIENLHAVPDEVPDDMAVFTEPLAAAFRILQQVDARPPTRVTVLGDGKLGLLVAMALSSTGCEPTLVGRHDRKLAIAAACGAKTTKDAPPAHSQDVVVEATGKPSGLQQALQCVRPRGTVILKSTFAEPTTLDVSRVVVDELRLLGSRCGPFETALQALRTGAVNPTPLIEARYPLRNGLHALEHAARRGTLKILLEP